MILFFLDLSKNFVISFPESWNKFFFKIDNQLINYIQYINDKKESALMKIGGLFFKGLAFIFTCFIIIYNIFFSYKEQYFISFNYH